MRSLYSLAFCVLSFCLLSTQGQAASENSNELASLTTKDTQEQVQNEVLPKKILKSIDENRKRLSKKEPVIMVIFGATGDLTSRKLLPAIYQLSLEGELPAQFACVGFARRDNSVSDFRETVWTALKSFSRTKPVDEQKQDFLNKIFYNASDFDQDSGYEKLKELFVQIEKDLGIKCNKIFYLATQPQFFPTIVEKLNSHNLISKTDPKTRSAKVIFEKPFGYDLESAISLKKKMYSYLSQDQILQIDHFLGKEGVQNLLNFRFSNPVFEELWSRKYIDSVQITIGEDIGIGTRGDFFEKTGMLRDIVQNHLMQILSLVAMEKPKNFQADTIQKEKIKLVRSIRQFPLNNLDAFVVRGQYVQGKAGNEDAVGYLQENNVAPNSQVETYVAAKLFIDNSRWKNVPFYIRAGKRLKAKKTEVVITFKQTKLAAKPNVLVIRIQPDEAISLKINSKIPGFENKIGEFSMDYRLSAAQKGDVKDAYELLFKDAIEGNRNNFVNFDELLASWEIFSPVLKQWELSDTNDLSTYPAGSWGPDTSVLFERKDQNWNDQL
jgi:glucose-6-phosphate 1-dehydrogenase